MYIFVTEFFNLCLLAADRKTIKETLLSTYKDVVIYWPAQLWRPRFSIRSIQFDTFSRRATKHDWPSEIALHTTSVCCVHSSFCRPLPHVRSRPSACASSVPGLAHKSVCLRNRWVVLCLGAPTSRVELLHACAPSLAVLRTSKQEHIASREKASVWTLSPVAPPDIGLTN